MSINLIATTGLSLLRTAQLQSQITSANMANANTDGYTVKRVGQTATSTNGIATGVDTTRIQGQIDRQLQRQLIDTLAQSGFKDTLATGLKDLIAVFGNPSDKNSSLSAKISTFEAKLTELKNTPDNPEKALQAVRALEDITNHLRSVSRTIQAQRTRISQNVESTVEEVNTHLKTIDRLNSEIAGLKSEGKSCADLEDTRRTSLKKLSQLINVSHFIGADNKAVITTTKGTMLLGGRAHTLTHSSPASLTHTAKYPASIPGILVGGKDITAEIGSGKLGALIRLRDTDLVQKHDELDVFATQLKDKLNGIAASGAAAPLPQTMTGDKKLALITPIAMRGHCKVVLTDDKGKTTHVHTVDLSTVSTVQDLITRLNGLPGVNASLDGDGHMVLGAQNSAHRIALHPGDGKSTAAPQQTLLQTMGIGTLLEGSGVHDIHVTAQLSQSPELFPKSSSTPTVGQSYSSTGNANVVSELLQGLQSHNFPAVGSMAAGARSFAKFGSIMTSHLAEKSAHAQQEARLNQAVCKGLERDIAAKSGVNMNEEIANLAEHQRAFQIAGHIMRASQDMFQTLLRMSH